jgi:hypothetical protein
MENFTNEIKIICDNLVKGFSQQSKEKSIMAYQRFNEYMLRLEGV